MILSTNKRFNLESICHMTEILNSLMKGNEWIKSSIEIKLMNELNEKVLIQLTASIKKTAILQMCRKIFNTGN